MSVKKSLTLTSLGPVAVLTLGACSQLEVKFKDITGTATSSTVASSSSTAPASSTPASTPQASLTQDSALALVLADAGLKKEEVQVTSFSEETNDGVKQIQLELTSNGKVYEYTLNADTGEILEKSEEQAAPTETTALSQEKREELLAYILETAGINAQDAAIQSVEQEEDNGQTFLDVDFVSGGLSYHFIINAETKDILESSVDNLN